MKKKMQIKNSYAYFAKKEVSTTNNYFHNNHILVIKVRQYHKLTTDCLYQTIICSDISMPNTLFQ